MFNDGEIVNGNTFMICQYEILRKNGFNNEVSKPDAVFLVDISSGEMISHIGYPNVFLDQPHEALIKPNDGNVLIANCRNDTIIEINSSTNEEIWNYNLRDLDWTTVNNTLFGPDSYVNNPKGDDWSHVNDVEYIERNGTEYLLITVRNFDMIYEINYTAAKQRETANAQDITWYFGSPGNFELLNHQHNADYLPNENILVADSTNRRIVEINYTTREIQWVSPKSLNLLFVRDADVSPYDNDTFLITDSLNHRIIEYDRVMGEIVWSYTGNLIQPYQADYFNGTGDKIVISDGVGARVFLLEKESKEIINEYRAKQGSWEFVLLIFILLCVITGSTIIFRLVDWKLFGKKKRSFIAITILSFAILGFFIYSAFNPLWLLKSVVQLVNVIRR